MADKEYYVKVDFEWGVDEDGEFTPKTTGNCVWASMPYEDSVVLQNAVVIPALKQMLTDAGELGMDMIGGMPDVSKNKPGKPV